MGIPAEPLPHYLVEWYRPGVDADRLDAITAKVDASSETVRAEGLPVRRVWTVAVPTDEVVFGVFAARSADSVVLVCQRAGMPVSRLSVALANRNRVPEP